MACGRAVLMFEPIAGHGKANAELMAQAGLATVCNGPAELTDALRSLAVRPALLAAAQQRALTHIGALDLDAEVAALPGLARHHGGRPLSALDAFFAHATTPTVAQQVGAVLMLDDQPPGGSPQQLADHIATLITDRELAAPAVRATAREHGVGTTALLLALVGEALHRADPVGTDRAPDHPPGPASR